MSGSRAYQNLGLVPASTASLRFPIDNALVFYKLSPQLRFAIYVFSLAEALPSPQVIALVSSPSSDGFLE
jgi:hypothetical protein